MINKLREHIINSIVDNTKVEVNRGFNNGGIYHIYIENHYIHITFRIRVKTLNELQRGFCDKVIQQQLISLKKYLSLYYGIKLNDYDLIILLYDIKDRVYNKYLIDSYHKCIELNEQNR